jgi:predicted ArsR family transcriptional regulator
MIDDRPGGLGPIAVLAEPVRRRLYELVVARDEPVDRDAAAAGVGIGRPLAAFHLDRLVEAGLLRVEFRRRSGRTGPGAGRPAKFYVRAGEREFSISLPPRHYDLAAQILAEGVDRMGTAAAGVLHAARERGTELAAVAAEPGAAGTDAAGPDALLALLAGNGYEPVVEPAGTVRLRNCPFHALVADHRELTCSMNLALLGGVVSGLHAPGLRAVAEPREGFCCVAFVPDEPSDDGVPDGGVSPGDAPDGDAPEGGFAPGGASESGPADGDS